VKLPNKPVLLAMASLVIIVGLIVSGSWYVLSRKTTDSNNQATAQDTKQTADNQTDGQKPATPGSPSNNNAKPTGETPPPSAPNKPATDSQTAKTNAISIGSTGFSPVSQTIKKGATITWTNKDSAAHAIASDGDNGLHSPQLQANQSYTYTFNTAGSFAYSDAMNPGATGTITVTNE
jgi:plastocyanin